MGRGRSGSQLWSLNRIHFQLKARTSYDHAFGAWGADPFYKGNERSTLGLGLVPLRLVGSSFSDPPREYSTFVQKVHKNAFLRFIGILMTVRPKSVRQPSPLLKSSHSRCEIKRAGGGKSLISAQRPKPGKTALCCGPCSCSHRPWPVTQVWEGP